MKLFRFLTASIVVVILFKCCVDHNISDPDIVDASDASLFAEANESGYGYYQSGNTLFPVAPSPHGMYKLRFNSVASQVLDASGELPENGRFPNGSILVKEFYQNGAVNLLIVIKKAPTDTNAGHGWLWGAYSLDGTPTVSIEEKGNKCTGCHNETPNRDMVRTFDLH